MRWLPQCSALGPAWIEARLQRPRLIAAAPLVRGSAGHVVQTASAEGCCWPQQCSAWGSWLSRHQQHAC